MLLALSFSDSDICKRIISLMEKRTCPNSSTFLQYIRLHENNNILYQRNPRLCYDDFEFRI